MKQNEIVFMILLTIREKIIIFIKYFQHPPLLPENGNNIKKQNREQKRKTSLRIHNPLLFISVLEGI